MPRPTVLLFDIDGTLITMGGVGRRAFDRTFQLLHGRADACASIRFEGMTDRATTRLAMQAIGVEATEANIDAFLAQYVPQLELELGRTAPENWRVHPGFPELLAAARARGAAIGLGTGNIEAGARLKLRHAGLDQHFAFGGFGDDHELRVELIRAGAQRGAARLGQALDDCRVVIIGDTPKDIDAARGIGAQSIGVGTGSFSPQLLRDHGATWAFDDLTAPGVAAALLDG